jgi:hypothetical protein
MDFADDDDDLACPQILEQDYDLLVKEMQMRIRGKAFNALIQPLTIHTEMYNLKPQVFPKLTDLEFFF